MSRRARRPRYQLEQCQRVHDRTSAIIPHNAAIVIDEVEDPYGQHEFARVDEKSGEIRHEGPQKITVVRSIRSDPLGALKAQGAIDEVQYIAGLMWSWSYARVVAGPLKAIDLTADRVSGSTHEATYQTINRAVERLRAAETALGVDGHRLVLQVIGNGLTLGACADIRGLTTKSGREYIGRRFRECLDCLAVVFGCATSIPSDRQNIPHQTLTPPR
jgi:hypothetical protein